MNGFINHLVERHLGAETVIKPRLPGIFEPLDYSASSFNTHIGINEPASPNRHEPDGNFETAAGTEEKVNGLQPDIASVFPINKAVPGAPEETAPGETLHPDAAFRNTVIIKSPESVWPVKNKDEFSHITGEDLSDMGNVKGNEAKETESKRRMEKSYAEGPIDKDPGTTIWPVIKLRGKEKNDLPIINPADEDKAVIKGNNNSIHDRGEISGANDYYPSLPIHQIRQDHLNYAHLESRQNAKPSIKITIGRIEVRAVSASAPSKMSSYSPQKPKMSLEDYLKKRNNSQ